MDNHMLPSNSMSHQFLQTEPLTTSYMVCNGLIYMHTVHVLDGKRKVFLPGSMCMSSNEVARYTAGCPCVAASLEALHSMRPALLPPSEWCKWCVAAQSGGCQSVSAQETHHSPRYQTHMPCLHLGADETIVQTSICFPYTNETGGVSLVY